MAKPKWNVKTAQNQKVRMTIYLSEEAAKRLKLHAMMADMDYSDMMEKIINENLKEFYVSKRPGRAGEGAGEPEE